MSDNPGITVLRLRPSLDPTAIEDLLRDLRTARNTAVVVEAGEEDQQLKTANAYRDVPLHSALIRHHFLEYVGHCRSQGSQYLFDDKPSGQDADWSHNLVCRFQRHLTNAVIVGKGRPTIYGMRHTFVDELQQADVAVGGGGDDDGGTGGGALVATVQTHAQPVTAILIDSEVLVER